MWYCFINGKQYGPMGLEQLQEWARTGSLRPSDLVWTEGMAEWAPAATIQGKFVFAVTPPVPPPTYAMPHRGPTVLVLGILGIVCCFILGIVAWVMGQSDLHEMKQGRRDPSGRGLTMAGMVCGIISVVAGLLGIVISILVKVIGHGWHHSLRWCF